MSPKITTIAGLLLLYLCVSSHVFAQNDSSAVAPPKTTTVTLKLLTWNVQLLPRYLIHWRFNSMQSQRIEWIAAHLNKQDFDVIALQEVFGKTLQKKLKKALADKYPYQVGLHNKKGSLRVGDGVLIVSKVPLKEIDYVYFSDGYDRDKLANKGCIMAQAEKEGVVFQLTNTHMQSINDSTARKVRESQVSEIKTALLDDQYQNGVPQFIMGDLNVRKSETEHYNNVLRILDARDTAVNNQRSYTFDQLNFWVKRQAAKQGKLHDNVQLDYILLRENNCNIEITDLRIQRITQQYKGRTIDLADHYGLMATFKAIISNEK